MVHTYGNLPTYLAQTTPFRLLRLSFALTERSKDEQKETTKDHDVVRIGGRNLHIIIIITTACLKKDKGKLTFRYIHTSTNLPLFDLHLGQRLLCDLAKGERKIGTRKGASCGIG